MTRFLIAVMLAAVAPQAKAQACGAAEGLVPRTCVEAASYQGYRDGFHDACILSGGSVVGEGINLTCRTSWLPGMRGESGGSRHFLGPGTGQGAWLDARLAPGGFAGPRLRIDDPVALLRQLEQAGLLERFGTEGWGVLRTFSMDQGLALGTPENPLAEFLTQRDYILAPTPLAAQELTGGWTLNLQRGFND